MTAYSDYTAYSARQTLPYTELPVRPPAGATSAKWTFGDWYLALLGFSLMGYAIGGRGFAYWGANPIFIGEICLLLGVVAFATSKAVHKMMRIPVILWLIVFLVWCSLCTIPYIPEFGMEAIRDAVLWVYAGFAFAMAATLIAKPTRLKWLVDKYASWFVVLFLATAPFTAAATRFAEDSIPVNPLTDNVPIFQVKMGDMGVHIAGVYAFLIALGSLSRMNAWLGAALICLSLGINLQGRAGIVSFGAAVLFCLVLRPFHHRSGKVLLILGLGLFTLWVSDLRLAKNEAREVSFEQLKQSMLSVIGKGKVGDTALEGSREWRLRWWTDIIYHTFGGEAFLTGDGFGINLAEEYGYEVGDPNLRSPHNGHFTVLARAGVPGFLLWVGLQGTWALGLLRAYIKSRRQKDWKWSGLFMFLLAYWLAFMANTTFDVFIEGPMGGVWMWSLFGVGLAALYIYKRQPEALYLDEHELAAWRAQQAALQPVEAVAAAMAAVPDPVTRSVSPRPAGNAPSGWGTASGSSNDSVVRSNGHANGHPGAGAPGTNGRDRIDGSNNGH